MLDENDVENAAYAIICPLTETVIECGAGVMCNGHHWAQNAVRALMASLRGDPEPLEAHIRRCLEVTEELRDGRRKVGPPSERRCGKGNRARRPLNEAARKEKA